MTLFEATLAGNFSDGVSILPENIAGFDKTGLCWVSMLGQKSKLVECSRLLGMTRVASICLTSGSVSSWSTALKGNIQFVQRLSRMVFLNA